MTRSVIATVKPVNTASGSPSSPMSRDVTFDLVLGRRHHRDLGGHVLFGSTVDGAAPDSSGKVGVFGCLASEKSCADQRLEGTVDERRMESVLIDLVGDLYRRGDVGYRPAVSGRDTGNGLECVTVSESDGSGASVELVAVNRGAGLCVTRRVGTVRRPYGVC